VGRPVNEPGPLTVRWPVRRDVPELLVDGLVGLWITPLATAQAASPLDVFDQPTKLIGLATSLLGSPHQPTCAASRWLQPASVGLCPRQFHQRLVQRDLQRLRANHHPHGQAAVLSRSSGRSRTGLGGEQPNWLCHLGSVRIVDGVGH